MQVNLGVWNGLCEHSVKASSLTPDTLSMESQRMPGNLKSPEITILSN